MIHVDLVRDSKFLFVKKWERAEWIKAKTVLQCLSDQYDSTIFKGSWEKTSMECNDQLDVSRKYGKGEIG